MLEQVTVHFNPSISHLQVLYYNPVAEQVVELARHPSSLPQVRPAASAQLCLGPPALRTSSGAWLSGQ